MSKILLLALLCTVMACGKKNNTSHHTTALMFLDQNKDQDFDGIPDEEEAQMGLDPLKANIPEFSIELKSNPNFEFKFFNSNNYNYQLMPLTFSKKPISKIAQRRKEAARLAYGLMYDLEEKMKLNSLNNLGRIPLKCLTQKENLENMLDIKNLFLNASFSNEKLSFQYQAMIKSMRQLNKIINPSYDLFINGELLFNRAVARNNYNLEQGNLAFSEIHVEEFFTDFDVVNDHFNDNENCLEFKINDFQYQIGNYNFQYKKQWQAIEQNNAHIVILEEGHLDEGSYALNDLTLLDFLRNKNLGPEIGINGNLLKLNNLNNEYIHFFDLDLSSEKDLKKRKWFVFSSDGSKIFEKLKPGVVYIVANLSVMDILKHATSKEIFSNIKVHDQFQIQDAVVGDRLQIVSEVYGEYNLEAPFQKVIDGYVKTSPSEGSRHARVNSGRGGCIHEESNELDLPLKERYQLNQDDLQSLSIFVGKTKREIYPLLKNNKLIYDLEIGSEDFDAGNIELIYKENSLRHFPYKRVIKKRDQKLNYYCAEWGRTNSVEKLQRKTTKKLNYIFDITRFGIMR